MPKILYLPRVNRGSSGIDITWTPSTQCLRISGWYDSIVGIESTNMSLYEFFTELGITEVHCRKALHSTKKPSNTVVARKNRTIRAIPFFSLRKPIPCLVEKIGGEIVFSDTIFDRYGTGKTERGARRQLAIALSDYFTMLLTEEAKRSRGAIIHLHLDLLRGYIQ